MAAGHRDGLASMRPPHYAGENTGRDRRKARGHRCFNEAPALRGGKLFMVIHIGGKEISFNEAPALRGGKHAEVGELRIPIFLASMRPPHYAGENDRLRAAAARMSRGFNEAPALRGGKRETESMKDRTEYASMRPPHYAGENAMRLGMATHEVEASMRPPHYAGENDASAPAAPTQPTLQ